MFRRILSVGVVCSAVLVPVASTVSAALYPSGPAPYPAFVTVMCPPEPTGPLEEAPAAIEGGRTVALTFDDGPGPSATPIMAILAKNHIRGTFFNDDTHWPSYLTTEYDSGFLMGNHTGNHHLLTGLRIGLQLAEIDRTIMKTYAVTKTSACVFRPPYGGFDNNTIAAAAQRRSGMWMWNVGTGDFLAQGSGSDYWIRHIWTSAVNPGLRLGHVTILMHDQHHPMPATVAALPIIIQKYRDAGYTFVDMLGRSGPTNTCPGPTPGPVTSSATVVSPGTTLGSGETRVSPNGQFTLSMNANGNLVVRITNGRVLWSSGTSGHAGATATFASDGTLSVADGGTTVWSASSTGATTLELGNNGNLAARSGDSVTWSTGSTYSRMQSGDVLRPGWNVVSPDSRCSLTQLASGELRLRSTNGMVIWRNGVSTSGVPETTLSASGSLVTSAVSGGTSTSAWNSAMSNYHNDTMTITSTGHMVFKTAGGVLFYTTP